MPQWDDYTVHVFPDGTVAVLDRYAAWQEHLCCPEDVGTREDADCA